VQLTNIGREELKRQHDKLNELFPTAYKYEPMKEDKDGWSKWQLWELMTLLGHKCLNGGEVPFLTSIRIDVETP